MENFFSLPSGPNLLPHARTFYHEIPSGLLAHEVFAMEELPFEGLSSSSPSRRRARGGGRGRSRHGRPAADDFDGAPAAVNVYCVLPEQPSDPVPLRVPIDPQANVNDLLQQVSLAAASVPKLGPRAFAWLRVDSISGPPLDPSASMSSFPGRQLYAVAISSQIATLNGPRGGPLPIGVGGYYTPSAQQSATAVGSVEAGEAAPWVPGEQRAVSSAHPPPPPPPPPPPSLPPPPLLPRTRARSWRASESRHRCRAQGYEAKQWSPSSPPFHHGPQSPHGAVRHAPIAPPIPPPAPIPPPTPPLGSTSGPLAPPARKASYFAPEHSGAWSPPGVGSGLAHTQPAHGWSNRMGALPPGQPDGQHGNLPSGIGYSAPPHGLPYAVAPRPPPAALCLHSRPSPLPPHSHPS